MIVVYPMLVSNAISENTLPAIAKMLEHYILIYMQNDYLEALKSTKKKDLNLRYKFKGAKLIGESIEEENLNETIPNPPVPVGSNLPGPVGGNSPAPVAKTISNQQQSGGQPTQRSEKSPSKKVDFKTSERIISIEPTKMEVYTERYGTILLGIKVVPYRVISDTKLSALLRHDATAKGLTKHAGAFGRMMLGALWRKMPVLGKTTGDPKKDIIYRTTGHKGETFVGLEKNYDIDEKFINDRNAVRQLYYMGWGNFVICDDSLQIAHFCLRALKGMCLTLSYRMMYQTLGQDKVYTDLEDARKQNSSIFKVSGKRLSKILGESKADTKLYHYQERQ